MNQSNNFGNDNNEENKSDFGQTQKGGRAKRGKGSPEADQNQSGIGENNRGMDEMEDDEVGAGSY